MSLKIWLPLTKDLRNQGLDNMTVTTANTNVFQNEGKLGGKSLDVSGHYAFRVPSLVKKRVFSCSFWYKPITDSSLSDNWRRIIVFDTYTSDGSTTGAIFRFESSYGYQSSSTTYCISIHNNVGEPIASIGTGLGATDGWNKWQHITITADGTTLRCYRDGVQVASGAMSNGGMLQGTVHIGYSGNRPVGRLNDFRLYDHCLSPMEVKELSKGLVLHYPLNRGGWGQENLIVTNSMTPTSGTSGWSSAGTGWANTNVTSSGASNGHAIRCTYSGTTQTSGGIHHPTGVDKTTLANGGIYTLSAKIRASKACIATFQNELMTKGNTINLTTNWQVYSYSCAIDNTKTYQSNVIYVRAADATQNMWIECDWIKLEAGDKRTPWCPNSSDALATTMDLNGTTEYDCSGYCNNGTRTGTFTWTSDTPKYSVSTEFSNNRIQCSGNFLEGLTTATLSAWIKLKSYHSERCMVIFVNGRYLTVNSSGQLSGYSYGKNPAGYYNSNQTIPLNTWTHITIVWSDTTWYFYINGALANSWSCTGTFTNSGNYISIGQEGNGGRSVNGQISDARVYATALSADDVRLLYRGQYN